VSGLGGLSSEEVVVGDVVSSGWWLVVDDPEPRGRVVAGPFAERADARWAAAFSEEAGSAHPVYGVLRADGGLTRRPSPEDWAWLGHLGEQLERLCDDWDSGLTDDDPLTTLAVEVTAALAETGLPLHDATGPGTGLGGACLSTEPGLDGIVVTWRQHDRMSVDQVHGGSVDAAVQQVMNRTLGDLLALRGFQVEPLGHSTGSVVRSARCP
jgi:hypothetical protein